MKNHIKQLALWFVFILSFSACNSSQEKSYLLNSQAFAKKIATLQNATIVDVRTPDEFSKGHIINAQNINWNDNNFNTVINKIDKDKPVFVYCLSGGRSARAVAAMRKSGFKQIYELDGGMLKWRSENMPETITSSPKSEGMSLEDYRKLLISEKLVLVDFYAKWCAPCKKMAPFLKEIAKENDHHVKVIRIDIDQNPRLTKALKINALPVLKLYKNQTIVWDNYGFVDKNEILNHLNIK